MRIRHMVVSAVAFAAILGNAPLASGTATPADPPAIIAPSAPAAVKTCVPREIVYDGIYRIDNDLFAGSPGQSCVVAKGGTVTITNCSRSGRTGRRWKTSASAFGSCVSRAG